MVLLTVDVSDELWAKFKALYAARSTTRKKEGTHITARGAQDHDANPQKTLDSFIGECPQPEILTNRGSISLMFTHRQEQVSRYTTVPLRGGREFCGKVG